MKTLETAHAPQRFNFTRNQSASNRTPRQINRNLVFNLIRIHQPVSRADIARISGLQRSTVSLIVEDLIKENWIMEGATGRLPRGRRPTFLQLNNQRAVIAVDVHPLRTTVAVADIGGRIIAQNLVPLPDDSAKAIQAITSSVKKLMAANSDKSFDGIGISLPGRTDRGLQKLIFAPNLNWPVLSLKSRMQRATGLRVEMDNVANACALSEVWFGESDGTHDLVVVNVSEGIGTGIFANGHLLRGEDGMAGEFGHVQVEPNGLMCGCGSRGCWETTASNRAGLRYFREISGSAPPKTFDALVKMAQDGDSSALAAIEKMSHALGRGLRMIASALAPSEIVVVGEVTTAWYLFSPSVQAEMKQNSLARSPKVRPSLEGNTARLRSAVALVMNEGPV
ncbi:MAG: ROK family transcriptional regulator [Acidobacteriaceae bacterium]